MPADYLFPWETDEERDARLNPPPIMLTPEQEIARDYIQRQRAARLPILIPVLQEATGWTRSESARFIQTVITETPTMSPDKVKMSGKIEKYCAEMGLPSRQL